MVSSELNSNCEQIVKSREVKKKVSKTLKTPKGNYQDEQCVAGGE